MLSGQKGGGTHAAPFAKEQKGYASTNTIREGPNGKHIKDLMPKPMPMPLGAERG